MKTDSEVGEQFKAFMKNLPITKAKLNVMVTRKVYDSALKEGLVTKEKNGVFVLKSHTRGFTYEIIERTK
jgi:hypothetical protein